MLCTLHQKIECHDMRQRGFVKCFICMACFDAHGVDRPQFFLDDLTMAKQTHGVEH